LQLFLLNAQGRLAVIVFGTGARRTEISSVRAFLLGGGLENRWGSLMAHVLCYRPSPSWRFARTENARGSSRRMHEGQGAKAEADDGWGSAILIVINGWASWRMANHHFWRRH